MSENETTLTAEDIKGPVSWVIVLHLSASDHYRSVRRCVEFPEITIQIVTPRGKRSKYQYSRSVFVAGAEVPTDHQTLADAINAHRATPEEA